MADKGLLTELLSFPKGWHFSIEMLAKKNRDGKDAIRSALKRLEAAGYITKNQGRNGDGKMQEVEYIIREQPHEQDPEPEQPEPENRDAENREPGNPMQLKDNQTKTIHFKTVPFCSDKTVAKPPERKRTEVTPDALEAYEEIIKDHIEYDILRRPEGKHVILCVIDEWANIQSKAGGIKSLSAFLALGRSHGVRFPGHICKGRSKRLLTYTPKMRMLYLQTKGRRTNEKAGRNQEA